MHPVYWTTESREIFAAENVVQPVIVRGVESTDRNKIGAAYLHYCGMLGYEIRILQDLVDNRPIQTGLVLRLDCRNHVIFETVAKKNVRPLPCIHGQNTPSIESLRPLQLNQRLDRP